MLVTWWTGLRFLMGRHKKSAVLILIKERRLQEIVGELVRV